MNTKRLLFIAMTVFSSFSCVASETELARKVEELRVFTDMNEKGVKAYSDRQYKAARIYFERALRESPGSSDALNNLALTLIKLRQYEEAVVASEKVIQLQESGRKLANAWYNKGLALEKLGKNESSLDAYQKANDLKSTKTRASAISRLEHRLRPKKKHTSSIGELRRNAGSDWSREKIIEYLKLYDLKLSDHGNYDYVVKDCKNLVEALAENEFDFVLPSLVVDDWSDPKLEVYKEKYENFRLGMGVGGNIGEMNASIPTWNINIYNVDAENDGVVETILYGERLRTGRQLNAPGHLGPAYLVFEPSKPFVRGARLDVDPAYKELESRDYILSGLIIIEDIYTVIVIYDHEILPENRVLSLSAYLVGKQPDSREWVKQPYKCNYEFVK